MFVKSGVFGYVLKNGKADPEYEICLACGNLKGNHHITTICIDRHDIINYEMSEMRELDLMIIEHYYFKKCSHLTTKAELLF